jgi:hypothetical protein
VSGGRSSAVLSEACQVGPHADQCFGTPLCRRR